MAEKTLERKLRPLGLLVILILLVWALFQITGDESTRLSGSTTSTRSASSSVPTDSQAFIIAQNFVKRALKAPTTADFPTFDYNTQILGNSQYRVASHVDAQNSFGAQIRTDWIATIRYISGNWADSSNWELEELVFDGEIIYEKEDPPQQESVRKENSVQPKETESNPISQPEPELEHTPTPEPETQSDPEPVTVTTPTTQANRDKMIEIFKAEASTKWGTDYSMVN